MDNPNAIILRGEASAIVPAGDLAAHQWAFLKKLWLDNQTSENTRRSYQHSLDDFIDFVNGVSPDQIAFENVQAWAGDLKQRRLADRSRNTMVSAVKSFFDFACEIKRLPFNVAHPVKVPRAEETVQKRILSIAQVVALMKAAGSDPKFGERDLLIFKTLYLCGLRIEELAELTWADVIDRDGLHMLAIFGKRRKSRLITITNVKLWQSLHDHRRGAPDEARIFCLSQSQIRRRLKIAASRAGLTTHLSPHWLRHCFGSHAIRRGAKIDVVSRDMGHSDIKTTHQYVHPPDEESAAAHLPDLD